MIIATRPPLLARAAARAWLALRLVPRIARLAAVFVMRPSALAASRTPILARFAAMWPGVGLRVGNRLGGLGRNRLLGARGRDGFAQLRKNFLQHDIW